MKRPSEAFCRSQAMWAVIIGLRGKATAIAVPRLMRRGDAGGDGERQKRIVLGLGRPEALVAERLDLPRVGGNATSDRA